MTTEDAPLIGRQASVTICDDVRREDNGKEIHIGVYSGGIVVPVVPFILPRLCFVFRYQCDNDRRPPHIEFIVQFPEMNREFSARAPAEALAWRDPNRAEVVRYFRVALATVHVNVPLRAEGRITIWVDDGDGRRCFYTSRVETRSDIKIPLEEKTRMIEQMRADIASIDRTNSEMGEPSTF